MKKMMKTWALIAAAAMGLTACQNDFEEQIEAEDSVVVTFVADSADTRTSVDTSGEKPVFTWDESESFFVLEQAEGTFEAVNDTTFELVDGKAHITAELNANPGKSEYKYVTIYPEDGYVDATSINEATLTLPAEQEMLTSGSYGASDLMVSEVVTTTAQPTEAQSVRFTRLAAVVKMTVKGLADGETVESVTFEAAGKQLAGEIKVDLEDPHAFEAGEVTSSSVTVTAHSGTANDIYFTVLPTTLEAGEAYSVTVVTKNKIYFKNGAIPAEKSLAFEAGNVTRFGVNLAGVEGIDKWTLVKDASTLKAGDVVAIVAKDYDKALSKNLYSNASETSTTAKRGLADVSKVDDYLTAGDDIQKLILVNGTVGNTFSFYDEARGKFLVSTTTGSTYLINQVYCDVNTSFAITIDDATTAATITNTEGAYKDNLLRYNTNGYFVSNQNTSAVYKDVCIYRLEGVVGTIPTVAANVTVPDSDESVVIAEEGAAEATAISEVVFNYVGDWTINATSEAEWLNVAYDATKNCLTYTADANIDLVRTTTVTITATLEGQDALTWSFAVLQKGVPMEISIAEFITKAVDENVSYKITGRVKVVPSSNSASATYEIEDAAGNVAKASYLYTEGGSLVKTDASIGLEVGDVVTITGVVGSAKGKIGGTSTYKSTYKGHYRLTATVEPAIVSYEGGDAAISVKLFKNGKLGAICAPTAIEGTMVENDFATFDYVTDATTATVSFAKNAGASREVEVSFKSGLAEATVSVGQQNDPSVKVGWFLVTDVNELSVGDKVIIAAKNPDETLDYAIKKYASNTGTSTGIAIELLGNAISSVDGVEQFTLGSGHADYEGTWSFVCDTFSRYLYVTSSNVKIKSTLDSAGAWTIAIAADGKATLTSKVGSTKNTMMFTYTTSNQTFSAQTASTTGKGAIYIYKYYNSLEQ